MVYTKTVINMLATMITNDTSRCSNNTCCLQQNCKRWLQWQKDVVPVWVSEFKPKNGKCDNQIKLIE